MQTPFAMARAGACALAAVLDAVASPVVRARLAAELAVKAAQYRAQAVGMAPLSRLQLAAQIRALLQELGGTAAPAEPSIAGLQAIAAGQHDGLGASGLLDKLGDELIDGWGAGYDEALSDAAADAAHAAINRWVQVEGIENA